MEDEKDDVIPCILEPEVSLKEYRKNWARLIHKGGCKVLKLSMKKIFWVKAEDILSPGRLVYQLRR